MSGPGENNKTGALLKARRKKRGLSFEQLYDLTRIQPEILKGIEEGCAKVPPVFLKGFVKTYARALGIKEEELQKEWLAEASREPSAGGGAAGSQKDEKPAAKKIISFSKGASKTPGNQSLERGLGAGGPLKKTSFGPGAAAQLLSRAPAASPPRGGDSRSFASAKKLAAVFGAGALAAALAAFLFQANFKGFKSLPSSLNAGKKSRPKAHKKIQDGGEPADFGQADSKSSGEGAPRQPNPEGLRAGALPEERQNPGFLSQVRQNAFQREVLIRAKATPLKIYFRADSGSIVIKDLKPLQWYSIKAAERIYLRFDGDSSSADLFYNGREVQRKSGFFERTFGGEQKRSASFRKR